MWKKLFGCQEDTDANKAYVANEVARIEEEEDESNYIHLNGFAEVSISFDEKCIEDMKNAWDSKERNYYYFSVLYAIRYTVDDDLNEFIVTGREREYVCDAKRNKAIDEVYESIQKFLDDEERMVKMMTKIVRRDFNERLKNENIEKVKKMLRENKAISVGFSTKVKK